MSEFRTISSISQFHALLGLDPPLHPLVSVINSNQECLRPDLGQAKYVFNLYTVAQKSGIVGAFGYGRNAYDFQDGTLVFTNPGQVISKQQLEESARVTAAWTLLFHPDLIRTAPLGKTIDTYTFFSYQAHEALHVSQAESHTLRQLVERIQEEYRQPPDHYTPKLLASSLELLLDYCARYFTRQFARRATDHQDVISQFEFFLKTYFSSDQLAERGLPTVQLCAQEIGMSANYLSDILKKETGQNAQSHIHALLLEKVKTLLLSSSLPVSQVAYALGFRYPQHLSKLFKHKTGLSPSAFRRAA